MNFFNYKNFLFHATSMKIVCLFISLMRKKFRKTNFWAKILQSFSLVIFSTRLFESTSILIVKTIVNEKLYDTQSQRFP